MMAPSFVLALLAGVLLALVRPVFPISKISVTGAKFFTDDGDQFFLKGIAYQLDFGDPLLDADQCTRDANLMKELGANSIRIYHVSPTGDHSGCMNAFESVGIYAFVDLDTFNTQIDPDDAHWNQTQFQHFTAVLDEFQQYDNLGGVFVGNEVLSKPVDSPLAVYVKAAARDLKAYRDQKGYRKIPIGYSAADIAELRPMLQNYLACGGNASDSIDFFSLNAYEWCSAKDDYKTSGYINLQNQAEGYPIPIFFSETGCITSPPRLFADQSAIFGPEMVNTWSGSIVYEWIQEANKYGLIQYGGAAAAAADKRDSAPSGSDAGGIVRSGTPTPISPDFTNLKNQWATLSPTGVKLSDYSASATSLSTPACPSSTASGWQINGNPSIPALGQTFNPTATAQQPSGTAASSPAATSSHSGAAACGAVYGATGKAVGMGWFFSIMMSLLAWL